MYYPEYCYACSVSYTHLLLILTRGLYNVNHSHSQQILLVTQKIQPSDFILFERIAIRLLYLTLDIFYLSSDDKYIKVTL